MAGSMSSWKTLFAEARRRKVLRVATLYAVIGFAALEAADIIFPTIHLPAAALTWLLVITLLGFPVVLAISWRFDLTTAGFVRTPEAADEAGSGGASDVARTTAGVVSEKSVAVLPFANMSDEDQNEYFSDGVTEEIINALTRIPELHVAARTSSFSFKGRAEDVTDIGRSLRVATLLEGSVRRVGDRVRITAQLVKTADGFHIWSETYDRELADIFSVQEEIAQTIAAQLKVEFLELSSGTLVQRHTDDLEAYNLYLKGRFFWNQREGGIAKGIESFRQAIAADPDYALAYSGLADSYNLLGFYGFLHPTEAFAEAKACATRALELDPDLGEAHVSLAFVHMLHDWNWTDAETAFQRGLELRPGYATGHHWYAEYLMAVGRAETAIREAHRAIELDPVGLIINTLLGMAYYFGRDYDRAIEACRRTLDLLPDFMPVYLWLGLAYVQSGRHEEAIDIFRKTVAGSNGRPAMTALLGYAYAVAGRTAEAETILADLGTAPEGWYVSPFDLARVQIGLGSHEAAMESLAAAVEEHAVGLVWAGVDPTLDPVRAEPGFRELLAAMDLPALVEHRRG